MDRTELEVQKSAINYQKQLEPMIEIPNVYTTIFKSIDDQLKIYLLPHMHSKVQQQLSESFLYETHLYQGVVEKLIQVNNFL